MMCTYSRLLIILEEVASIHFLTRRMDGRSMLIQESCYSMNMPLVSVAHKLMPFKTDCDQLILAPSSTILASVPPMLD